MPVNNLQLASLAKHPKEKNCGQLKSMVEDIVTLYEDISKEERRINDSFLCL